MPVNVWFDVYGEVMYKAGNAPNLALPVHACIEVGLVSNLMVFAVEQGQSYEFNRMAYELILSGGRQRTPFLYDEIEARIIDIKEKKWPDALI